MVSTYVEFVAKAVIFDLEGTLTDSTVATEAAWNAVAQDMGHEGAELIAATMGRMSLEHLRTLKPLVSKDDLEDEVQAFERSILAFADDRKHGGSRRASSTSVASADSSSSDYSPPTKHDSPLPPAYSFFCTDYSMSSSKVDPVTNLHLNRPSHRSPLSSGFTSRSSSPVPEGHSRESFARMSLGYFLEVPKAGSNCFSGTHEIDSDLDIEALQEKLGEILEGESCALDRGVKSMPGARKLMNSLPMGSYAIATNGLESYCLGSLEKVGFPIPTICVTGDHPDLTQGKPFPDPYILAAKGLHVSCSNTLIVEDSPSGIKAALASGAAVIAVCSTHRRSQLEGLGADYVVDTLDQVTVTEKADGSFNFRVTL